MVCPTCRKFVAWTDEKKCEACGGDTFIVPRNWSPPKQRNDRAWKRIAKGEVLWDRRRVRRNPRNAAFDKDNWVKLPGHKRGQRGTWLGHYRPSKNGPDVDLGG